MDWFWWFRGWLFVAGGVALLIVAHHLGAWQPAAIGAALIVVCGGAMLYARLRP